MLAGRIAHGGNILGEAKAGYRRANDKGQWWEAGASGKARCNMAARLTDRQKKKILADYVQTSNYCATAKLNGVSATTVKNIVRANADIVEKCEQKKEENTADVLAYMESQRDVVCQIIGKGLAVLNDPAKLAEATPSQITTAIGTLIDKWTMMNKAGDNGEGGVVLMPEVMDE